METELIIRDAEFLDLSAIVDIYNQAIRSKNATGDIEEFKMVDRIKWFETFNKNNFPMFIAEKDNNVLGYCTISPYRPGRKAMTSVAEITFYLDLDTHGKDIGKTLIEYAILKAHRIGKKNLVAVLVDSNDVNIELLEEQKFQKWGHLPELVEFDGISYGHLIYGLKL